MNKYLIHIIIHDIHYEVEGAVGRVNGVTYDENGSFIFVGIPTEYNIRKFVDEDIIPVEINVDVDDYDNAYAWVTEFEIISIEIIDLEEKK